MAHISEQFGGFWSVHPDYSIEDWQNEVANDCTRKGYWEWVEGCIERDSIDNDEN